MRRILLLVMATLLAACGRSRPEPDVVLAGTWNVELSRGKLPWSTRTVYGQIRFAAAPLAVCGLPEDQAAPDAALCHTNVTGTYSIALDSLVDPHPYAGWTPDATAIARANGTILLQIGGCCDRGEIVGEGRIDGNRMEGGWYQQFLNNGPRGRFVLRRAP